MKKTRAAVMGTNAFPYLMRYQYELFTKVWSDEVDRLYIIVSKPGHPSSWGYIKALLSSHKKITVIETNTMWPESINIGTRKVQEDLLFICHDDTLIFKKGVLDGYFRKVEEENVVVTPVTPIFAPQYTIEELLKRNWPEQLPIIVEETGEKGWSFYANMLFLSRDLLSNTTIDFGAYHKAIGEHCPLMNWTPLTQPWGADTNFLLELELLKAGAKFHGIKKQEFTQLYNLPEPVKSIKEMVEKAEGIFAPSVGWVHLQTMAYHIHGLYWDPEEEANINRSRADKVRPLIENYKAHVGQDHFMWSHALRLAWVLEFMETGDYSGMKKYHNHAQKEIDYIIDYIGIDRDNLKVFQDIFHNLIWQQ